MKTNNEEVTTSSALASHSASDGVAHSKSPALSSTIVTNIPSPDGHFAGKPYFKCDSGIFNKCYQGRAKGQRWTTFAGNNERVEGIRRWARKNNNPDFLLRNSTSGEFLYAQKGIKKVA